MQKYDFTAPANGAPQIVNVPGRYIKYVTGSAGGNDTGLIVTPGGKPGSKILLYPGQAMTLPNDGTAGPNAWTIANAVGQGSITGTVVIGNGKIDDNTLSGTVSVMDGGKTRTLAGSAFIANQASGVAGAGQYALLAMWNPAGSARRAVVEKIGMSCAVNVSVDMYGINAALANDLGAAASKLIGSTAQSAVHLQNAVAAATTTQPSIIQISVQANAFVDYVFTEPLVILPGNGLVMHAWNAAVQFAGFFEWFEEPNV